MTNRVLVPPPGTVLDPTSVCQTASVGEPASPTADATTAPQSSLENPL